MLAAIKQELVLKVDYLSKKKIKTIYFGGGTPSVLNADELNEIFSTINQHYQLTDKLEITLEANPDDLSEEYLQHLAHSPINRLSIGVQSFFEEDLKYMNRSHNAQQAEQAIKDAQHYGFNNLSIDLIYGSPTLSNNLWQQNLDKAIAFNVPHISSYALTVEPKTALAHNIKTGKSPAPNDALAAQQFKILSEQLQQAGYLHYEISNFGKEGKLAQHNSNYWKGAHYLGVGPSAHSFNGVSRSWNIANNSKYIKAVNGKTTFTETEHLSKADQFNEFVMVGLRTMWGISLKKVSEQFGQGFTAHLNKAIKPLIADKLLEVKNETIIITSQSKFLADAIIADLFWIED